MCFFFNDTATTEIYTLSLHDALPISLNAGNLDAAVRDLQASVDAKPSVDGYFALGNAFAQQDRMQEAINAYDQALKLDPEHTASLANRGVAYYRLGQLDAAIDSYQKALKIDSNDAETSYLLGAAQLQQGNMSAAEAAFKRSLELKPDLPDRKSVV